MVDLEALNLTEKTFTFLAFKAAVAAFECIEIGFAGMTTFKDDAPNLFHIFRVVFTKLFIEFHTEPFLGVLHIFGRGQRFAGLGRGALGGVLLNCKAPLLVGNFEQGVVAFHHITHGGGG